MPPMRRSSWCSTTNFRSRRRTLVLTIAPASRQTRAAALSSRMARGRNKPERGQDARWSPKKSRRRRQGQMAGPEPAEPQAAELQRTEGSGLEPEFWRGGQCRRVLAANGPDWDCSKARDGSFRRCVRDAAEAWSTAREADRWHPRVRSAGSSSSWQRLARLRDNAGCRQHFAAAAQPQPAIAGHAHRWPAKHRPMTQGMLHEHGQLRCAAQGNHIAWRAARARV